MFVEFESFPGIILENEFNLKNAKFVLYLITLLYIIILQ